MNFWYRIQNTCISKWQETAVLGNWFWPNIWTCDQNTATVSCWEEYTCLTWMQMVWVFSKFCFSYFDIFHTFNNSVWSFKTCFVSDMFLDLNGQHWAVQAVLLQYDLIFMGPTDQNSFRSFLGREFIPIRTSGLPEWGGWVWYAEECSLLRNSTHSLSDCSQPTFTAEKRNEQKNYISWHRIFINKHISKIFNYFFSFRIC